MTKSQVQLSWRIGTATTGRSTLHGVCVRSPKTEKLESEPQTSLPL